MNLRVLSISGIDEALYGLGLSYGKTKGEQIENMKTIMLDRANKNVNLGLGHNKFLESIIAWIEITAPRFMWSEIDTYRLMTKQSDSTMHTLLKEENISLRLCNSVVLPKEDSLTKEQKDELTSIMYDLEQLFCNYGSIVNRLRLSILPESFKLHIAKSGLPETWEQTRVLCVSYKTLKNMYEQRKNHKLVLWRAICEQLKQLPYSEWITSLQ